jgi:hypothetical protein
MVQNSVRTTNPENCLIGFFLDFENQGGSQNEIFFKTRTRAVLKTCPKNWNQQFSGKSENRLKLVQIRENLKKKETSVCDP